MIGAEKYFEPGTPVNMGLTISFLIDDIGEWSATTFGTKEERGPVGSLKHLQKEAQECIDNPSDIVEFADCLILLIDATWRAGHKFADVLQEAKKKMVINKARVWPKPTSSDPVEHERAPNDP